jgi:hypothetical protein
MKYFSIFAAALAFAGPALAQTPTVRVGTFHQPSLVVAFYRSPMWAERMKSAMQERERAKQANDTKKVAELEAWGSGQQELAHKQLEGEAPITNILEQLAGAFPVVAQKAQVALIVADVRYASGTVQTVDVTDHLLDWMKADEATRKIVRELRARPMPPH